jgi:hypothetical protein
MQITGLLEKNYILKERNVELELVLKRWQADIDETAAELADLLPVASGVRLERGGQGGAQGAGSQAAASVEKAARLASQAEEWQRRSLDLEGAQEDLRAKLDRANSRLEEMAHLVDVLTSEGDSIKGEATRQLTRVRAELENAHASEVRALKVAGEDDRRSLMEQLDALAGVVDVARLSSIADALANEGKSGSYTRLMAAMKKAVDAREYWRGKKGGASRHDADDGDYGGGARDRDSAHRQTQTAFVQSDPALLRGLEEQVARLRADLEVERARHATARAEVRRRPLAVAVAVAVATEPLSRA